MRRVCWADQESPNGHASESLGKLVEHWAAPPDHVNRGGARGPAFLMSVQVVLLVREHPLGTTALVDSFMWGGLSGECLKPVSHHLL